MDCCCDPPSTNQRQRPELLPSHSKSRLSINDAALTAGYEAVPYLEVDRLPRGGVSVETKAVGRIQFGLPPETIKDSMLLGISVPSVYIVPVERFCREASPALGINLAEFEFPCYFNYFVRGKRCTLIVDSRDAEAKITQVFQETLMGPEQFRHKMKPHEAEDFHSSYPVERRPDFAKESDWFRRQEATAEYDELCVDMLLDFKHFETAKSGEPHSNIGFPPPPPQKIDLPNIEVKPPDDDDGVYPGSEMRRRMSSASFHGCRSPPHDLADPMRRRRNSTGFGNENNSVLSTASPWASPMDETNNSWSYSQLKWLGDVCTIYPHGNGGALLSTRVEIFRMAGGTEYIIHDIDEHNCIIGKTCFIGTVQVSDSMEVIGFAPDNIECIDEDDQPKNGIPKAPTFIPPYFGVTVLGNSHGFDKTGSTSGYVLWINGRGVMIDPPPYSSVTLEREGIRPRLIVAIIVTHIHADHDGGAFQKLLTGSRVSVITTPTIYKSFIRKYAALSGLSPSILRHSHRCRPAIIGQPLRFHGATFHFTYSLHTIPCIAFRVEWGGKAIVFTGDHMNNPPVIRKLEKMGVMSKERADELINLPHQDCDLLLHESGAPPIHTQLDVLLALPEKVKERMYIVHTAALPKNCPLKVAPTGTNGTIRLDQHVKREASLSDSLMPSSLNDVTAIHHDHSQLNASSLLTSNDNKKTSVSDAWFVLNLLSEVPFLSSLPYSATMELLEAAQVDVFKMGAIVVPAECRSAILCVFWEGTCIERKRYKGLQDQRIVDSSEFSAELAIEEDLMVWHAGDWTGPLSFQPDLRMSGESRSVQNPHDVVALSEKGVKVISWDMKDVCIILQSCSPSYKKYLADNGKSVESDNWNDSEKATINTVVYRTNETDDSQTKISYDEYSTTESSRTDRSKQYMDISFLDVLRYNSALKKLTAVQKRHLESLSEGPSRYDPGRPIWLAGRPVDFAYLIISGTAFFQASCDVKAKPSRRGSTGNLFKNSQSQSVPREHIFAHFPKDKELKISPDSEYARLENYLQDRVEEIENEAYDIDLSPRDQRLKDSRDRFANIVLGRLYSRRSWTAGLTFSRGHFLCDTSRMLSGSFADSEGEAVLNSWNEFNSGKALFRHSRSWIEGATSDEPLRHSPSTVHNAHSTNLIAGSDGCTVLVFPRKFLISFLDQQPGLLLSFLGTQAIV